MASSDEPASLRALLDEAETRRHALDALPDARKPSYARDLAALLALYEQLRAGVAAAALFSPNETLDDLTTSSLPFLLLDFHAGELAQRAPGGQPAQRREAVARAAAAYERFLALADSYALLPPPYARLWERYREDPPAFAVEETAEPARRREAKLAAFRAEKALRARLDGLRAESRFAERNEEAVREVYLAQVACAVHDALQALDALNRESALLALAPDEPAAHEAREDPSDAASSSTTRLDAPPVALGRGGPLLSQQGQPLQPFTLVGRRAELARGVFRPGHNLPTMSIDEYLEEERRRGNILEGGGAESARTATVDEDDMEAADRATYAAREWDEFKDANPRGSGNTLNMG